MREVVAAGGRVRAQVLLEQVSIGGPTPGPGEGATVPAFLADGSLVTTPVTLENVRIVNQPAPYLPASSSVLVASLDETKTVRTSRRLLAVVSTDALNSGQIFKDYRRLTLMKNGTSEGWGTTPVLLRRAKLELRIRNDNAANAFSFAGQSCISVQRVLVHDDVAEELTARSTVSI